MSIGIDISISVSELFSFAPSRKVSIADLDNLKEKLESFQEKALDFSYYLERFSEDDAWFCAHEDEYDNLWKRLRDIEKYCDNALDCIKEAKETYTKLEEDIEYIFGCVPADMKGVA